jgi:hypothetical protein
MATFDTLFRGVGKDLVELFGSNCVYSHRSTAPVYDPLSGSVVDPVATYAIKAGVEEMKRLEGGGVAETYEALMWFSHVLLPVVPTTSDSVTYQGKTWQVVAVDPQYAGDQLIAFKLRVRSN